MYTLVSKNYKTMYWLIRIQMEHQILIAPFDHEEDDHDM